MQCFLGKYDQCDLDTEQALNILGEIDDKQLIAFNMSISAFNYCYRKDYDAALEKVELSLPMWQKSGNNYGTVMCDVISGMVYLKTDQTDKFQQVFSRYEDATVETIDKTFLYWEKQLKSRWLVEEGHFDKAFKMTRKNLKNLLDKGIKLILPDELELMAHLVTEKNLTKEAIQFYSYAQDLRSHFKIAVPPIWKQDHTDLSLKLEISSKTHDHPKPNTRQNISTETIITMLETI